MVRDALEVAGFLSCQYLQLPSGALEVVQDALDRGPRDSELGADFLD